jgi:hypothetical protein
MLHDAVGVYDTQEPGYEGNTLAGAWRKCRDRTAPSGEQQKELESIRKGALAAQVSVCEIQKSLEAKRPCVAKTIELDDLLLAAEKISAHAEREVLLIETQGFLMQASRLPLPQATAQAAAEAKRWNAHRVRMEAIARKDARLCRRGDPCGYEALFRDIATAETYLSDLAKGQALRSAGTVAFDEQFEKLDPARWILQGQPQVVGGRLETKAPGGWSNRCGIATRQAYALEKDRPLIVEFTLSPLKMGVDSQMFASTTETGTDSYRFAFYGPASRFGIYTRSEHELPGPWVDKSAGWRLRAESAPVELNKQYRVCAEIRLGSFRVVVRMTGDSDWEMPFWDSRDIPMDALPETRLGFADVEPDGSTASSRWGPIVISRP